MPFGVVSLDGKGCSIPGCDDWVAQRQTQGESGALVGIVRTVTATLTSCDARPIIDVAESRDLERGSLVVRRLFIGKVTDDYDGWPHLRTVLRIQTGVFDCETGEEKSSDERYLISSLPRVRLTPQHWLLVIRRHWGVETSHQIFDAYTLLALFRSVTQRSDERRAVPWKTLMSETEPRPCASAAPPLPCPKHFPSPLPLPKPAPPQGPRSRRASSTDRD